MPRSILLFSLLAGCAAAPAPLVEPTRSLTVTYERAAAAAPGHTPASRRLEIAAFAVARPLDGDPIDAAIVFIAAGSGAPFRGASALVQGMRVLRPTQAAAWLASARAAPATAVPVGAAVAVLAAGITTRIDLADLPLPDVSATLAGDTLPIALVSRPADLGLEELVQLANSAHGDGDALVLFAARPAPGRAGYALVLTPGPPLPATDVLAAQDLANAGAATARSVTVSLPLASQLEIARQSIGERNRFGALLALATRLDLPRCIDLLLAADEPVLVAITDALPGPGQPGDPGLGDAAPWQVERAMWTATLPVLQRGEASTALLACTSRQLGAAALDHGALQLLLATSEGPAEFAAGLREENLAALDDPDASSRVQAHAWLAAHGGSVNGYDPLGERAARQQAVRRHAASAPTQQPGAGK